MGKKKPGKGRRPAAQKPLSAAGSGVRQAGRPFLSIGMIFRNEIRCLERCLKSLQPLREAFPCELVMADTGSDDGSREVAARYADILLDFPWINDFSAARNAVLSRCTGEWYLTIDCDEWLEENLSPFRKLGQFPPEIRIALLTQRNYKTPDLSSEYSDVLVPRLFRNTGGVRYWGVIHEQPQYPDDARYSLRILADVILHHDGYALEMSQPESVRLARNRRNTPLLREELRQHPDNLFCLDNLLRNLYNRIETENRTEHKREYAHVLRHAVSVLESEAGQTVGSIPLDGLSRDEPDTDSMAPFQRFGPSILRSAVVFAYMSELPEFENWSALAFRWFPKVYVARIDIKFFMALHSYKEERNEDAVCQFREYFQAVDEFSRDRRGQIERANYEFIRESEQWREYARMILAGALARTGAETECGEILESLHYERMNAEGISFLLNILNDLHTRNLYAADLAAARFWERIARPNPSKSRARDRKLAFLRSGSKLFQQEPETEVSQPGWKLFCPLEGQCVLGDAAAMMSTEDPERLAAILRRQAQPGEIPSRALIHALRCGADVSVLSGISTCDEMDILAEKMRSDPECLYDAALRYEPYDERSAYWSRAITCAAIRSFPWEWTKDDSGVPLIQKFAQAEKTVLDFRYTSEMFQEPMLSLLPSLDAAGYRLVRAIDGWNSGDAEACMELLRLALNQKSDIGNAIRYFQGVVQDRKHGSEKAEKLRVLENASPELLRLAEQVQAILARYPADDPAVLEIRRSPAYQKVAWIIEGEAGASHPAE